jgi:hypothetical protein
MDNVEFEILKLCKKNSLKNKDVEFLNYVFSNNIIDKNYCDSEFLELASYYENFDMIKILCM